MNQIAGALAFTIDLHYSSVSKMIKNIEDSRFNACLQCWLIMDFGLTSRLSKLPLFLAPFLYDSSSGMLMLYAG